VTGAVSTDPIRIGVLGAARIAELAIVGPARATGHRLVAVAARDQRRAEDFARRHGVERTLGSYADVLADPDVEVIYNPLANALHGPWNLAAIQAGKHVLSEKPFASNADEARFVRDAAAMTKLTVMEGFHYLYHPVTRRLHELLDSGELGELRAAEIDMFMPAPDDGDPRWSYELAGGALMDIGCYSLHAHRALAFWADGPPRVAAARAGRRAGHPGIDEWLDADLEFPGGATGRARCHMSAGERRYQCRIIGSSRRSLPICGPGPRCPPVPTTPWPPCNSSTTATEPLASPRGQPASRSSRRSSHDQFSRKDRRCTDLLGCLRGTRLGVPAST
jgi:predicted dehydrogenase